MQVYKQSEHSPVPNIVPLLSAEEAGKVLGISTRTLYTFSANGELPCIKVGRCVRYDRRDIEAYINKQRSTVKGEKHG